MKTRAVSIVMTQIAALALGWLAATPVYADTTYTVDTPADQVDVDPGDRNCRTLANACSLRAAIMEANAETLAGLVRIRVPAGTFTLTRPVSGPNGDGSGDLNLTQANTSGQFVEIVGAGAASTIVDGGQLDGVISIAAGRNVRISGITIRNGRTFFDGGGVLNRGVLTLTHCVIEANRAGGEGGGIFNTDQLTIVGGVVAANVAQNSGGGISSSGALLVQGSTIRLNSALGLGNGGGLFLSGPTTVRSSTVYGNSANSGGGMLTMARLTVLNSTISGNAANLNGGGIYNFGITNLLNSSVIDNDADHDRDQEGGIGGGVYSAAGAGLYFLVTNSLIARNTVLDAPIYNDCSGQLEAFGRNFFYDLDGCSIPNPGSGFVSPGSIGPLQNNGGATMTHALLPGSQAIDATADNLGCTDDGGDPLTVDQRDIVRPAGIRCDVGAYEFGSLTNLIFRSGFN